jgi:hypothetical protein
MRGTGYIESVPVTPQHRGPRRLNIGGDIVVEDPKEDFGI